MGGYRRVRGLVSQGSWLVLWHKSAGGAGDARALARQRAGEGLAGDGPSLGPSFGTLLLK